MSTAIDNAVKAVAPATEVTAADPSLTQLWLEFIARLMEAFAWPAVAIIFMVLFRGKLASVASNLRTFKWGDAEATFGEELRSAAENAKAIEPAPAPVAEDNRQRLSQLIEMAAISPTGAIIGAWKDMESAAWKLIEEVSSPGETVSKGKLNLFQYLSVRNLLPSAELEMFNELRVLRNKAVHGGDESVTVDDARKYVRLADKLTDIINQRTLTQQVINANSARWG